MTPLIIALAAGTLFIGSFVQGMVGFGLGMVSVPILSLFLDVKMAIPIATVFGWLITIPVCLKMRQHINFKLAFILYLPAIVGIQFGGELLKNVESTYILLAMGIILIFVGGSTLINRPIRVKNNIFSAVICGLLSGVLGAGAGESGPPIVTYMNCLKVSAEKIKATTNFYFFLAMLTVIFKLFSNGVITQDVSTITAWSIPAMLGGGIIGMRLFDYVQRKEFDVKKIMNFTILILGIIITCKGISHF
ncbi:sulfite exporter TauE/SafE family protein [Photobacterium indicum]|uniref:sulfite exporter TauE/SafE family protein n=1 Tax=Photobacterium indicum TaxID=81447 RepID=UPI003D0FB2C5